MQRAACVSVTWEHRASPVVLFLRCVEVPKGGTQQRYRCPTSRTNCSGFLASSSFTHRNCFGGERQRGQNKSASPAGTDHSATKLREGTMTEVDYNIQSAAQPWSLTHPDSSTLRFELRPEDHWASDYSTAVQRTEIIMHNNGNVQLFQAGTPLEITYNFRIEPGPVTTAYFTTLGQMHAESDGVPPYYIQLTPGDHMEVTLGNGTPQNHHFWNAYVDPNPLIRDHTYSMKIDTNFATDSSGYLYVWRDGVQIVNYHGPIGYGDATYWKEGIYRAVDPGNQTIAVDYSNLKITTPTDSIF